MKALSLLIKPASGNCNMRCRYCFYADVSENRQIQNYGVMETETLEILVRKSFSEAEEQCVFGFQGGEPTLAGLDFFKEFIELEKKYNVKKIKTTHTLQTNGLTLDGDWAEFFKKNNFLVGLSVDAYKSIHDSLRPDASGKGTHGRCMESARLFTEFGVDFNILSVVTSWLAAHPDNVYRFYKQNGFRFIQFIPCIDGLGEQNCPGKHLLEAKKYGNFLCRIFDLWYEDFIKGDYYSIRAFDNYLHILLGHPPENCAMNGVCSPYAIVEANGDVFPCDFYATDGYLLGNVKTNGFDEMLSGEKALRFIEPSRYADPACRECEYGFICRGGCRRDREPLTDGIPALNRYCGAYKSFFVHALPKMKFLADGLRKQYR